MFANISHERKRWFSVGPFLVTFTETVFWDHKERRVKIGRK